MLIEYLYISLYIGIERDLVVIVKCCPDLFRRWERHFYGFSFKGGKRIPVTLVCAYEICFPVGACLIGEKFP